MPHRPRLTINADGTYGDGNAAALALLGVTLDELLVSPPGRFAVESVGADGDAAFMKAWQSSGRPDIAGATTIRRADGTTVRVKFSITEEADHSFTALLTPVSEPVAQPTVLFTTGDVLAAWRAAERRPERLLPDDAEALAIEADIREFREGYQALFDGGRDN
jgi:PAS domain-containing protein